MIGRNVTSIGYQAFIDCTGLISVTSLIDNPFEIEESVFRVWDDKHDNSTFTSAALYVPKGTKEKYEATAAWNRFQKIEEMKKGDANVDMTVDVADIASVIDVMARSGNDAAADVNGDGTVDVADIAAIIDEMAANVRMKATMEE